MTQAHTVMVQGTASNVGKSLIAAGLCRLFRNDGLSAAPFKSQNMSLNAHVTADGLEIGRAQASQAEAAGIEATVDMNPILLKPEGESRSQVVVMGRAHGSTGFSDYHRRKRELGPVITQCLERLRNLHDVVVIEGAGSPAEINLQDRDIVNMYVARAADAPVILVGDIDRGGVFAAFVGTLALLPEDDRRRVKGLLVNKFRGDVGLLQPGLDELERLTGIPVLGVIPYLPDLRIAEEDCLALTEKDRGRRADEGELSIVVPRLPRICNYDDLEPLEAAEGVRVSYVANPEQLAAADLVVLPGSKATIHDLQWLKDRGFGRELIRRAAGGRPILGICGGCQMLGERIDDPKLIESPEVTANGLGLLPLVTTFRAPKLTTQVRTRLTAPCFLGAPESKSLTLSGYEIHMGRIAVTTGQAAFEIERRIECDEGDGDGAVSDDGVVIGTMIHGLFENEDILSALLDGLWKKRGIVRVFEPLPDRDHGYDRLANALREHCDMDLLDRIVRVPEEYSR